MNYPTTAPLAEILELAASVKGTSTVPMAKLVQDGWTVVGFGLSIALPVAGTQTNLLGSAMVPHKLGALPHALTATHATDLEAWAKDCEECQKQGKAFTLPPGLLELIFKIIMQLLGH